MLPAGLQIMFANSTKLSHSCDLSMCWSAAALLCESVVKYFLGWGKSISRGGGRRFDGCGESQLLWQTPLSAFACPGVWPLRCKESYEMQQDSSTRWNQINKIFQFELSDVQQIIKHQTLMMTNKKKTPQSKFIVDIVVPLKSRWLWALCQEEHIMPRH